MKNLKAFHVFDVAADSSSFSKAAEKLFITHGAVSKQIKTLEKSLSLNLFYRQGRNVRLTHEGELLKGYTTQAFQALNAGVQKLSQINTNCLDVSCEPTLTMRWLMPRISNFYENNPNADVRLSTAGGPVVLGSSSSSLAIRRNDFELIQDYKKVPLVDEWVGPVVCPEYWQRVKSDLSQIKLIHSDTRPKAWSNWSNISRNTSLLNNSYQTFAHFYFCFQAAVDGLGAAIGSYPLVVDDLKRGNLIAPFGFVLSGNSYILIAQERASDNDLEKQFTNWIKDQLLQCVPTNDEILKV